MASVEAKCVTVGKDVRTIKVPVITSVGGYTSTEDALGAGKIISVTVPLCATGSPDYCA